MDSFDRRLFLKRTSVAAAVATTATVAGVPGMSILEASAQDKGKLKKSPGNFGSPVFIRIDDFSGKIHIFKDDREFEVDDFFLANAMARHAG
jgi:hypothetical protein